MKFDLDYVTEKLREYYEIEEWDAIYEHIETLEFKINKSEYHLNNIKEKINLSTDFERPDYYERICSALYYEVESFIIGVRSTVDIIMHVLNKTLYIGLEKTEVNLSSIYKHYKTTTTIKNVLHRYTHNRDSTLWNFIYRYRNEVVHEKSISQLLELTVDIFSGPKPLAYFEINGEMKNVVSFFESCINFLQRFIIHLFEAITVTIELKKQRR